MNSFFWKLCWKNIWRNKRRTFLAVNAIAIGATFLIYIHNYQDALHEQFISNAIRFQNGHIMISKPGFHEYKESKRFIRSTTRLDKWLATNPAVKAASPQIIAQGLLSSAKGGANIFYVGIDPTKERLTTHYHERMVEGSYFENLKKAGKPIVIGVGLKERLKVRLGSKLVALTQGVDGSIGNELFYVAGIFNTESDLDKSLAFIQLKDARALLSMGPQAIHQVSILLKQETTLDEVQSQLKTTFPRAEVMSWKEVQKHLMASIEVYHSATSFFMFIILFISAVGISNSILMGIMERTREFGVMMAIGTAKADMVRMVLAETLLLSAVGIFIGNVVGLGITLYFHYQGFDLAWLTTQEVRMNGALVQTVTYPAIHYIHNVTITSIILLLSLVAALIPIQFISKLKATTALKSH